jgi:GR25 family glycosyltransferase involved in LPS biosynthesis
MNNINTFFDKIFVMSPANNTERREYINKHFYERGITNWEFHDAIDYRLLTAEARIFLGKSGLLSEEGHPWLPLNDTQIVACLSFMQMLLKAKGCRYQRILHVEDDIYFYDDYETLFDTAVSNLPDDWDAVHFYSHIPVGSQKFNDSYREKINSEIYKGFSEGSGALCIGYNRRAVNLMFTRVFPIDSGIDGIANTASGNWYEGHEDYIAYICKNFICRENRKLPNSHSGATKSKNDTRKAQDEHLIPPHMTTNKEKEKLMLYQENQNKII